MILGGNLYWGASSRRDIQGCVNIILSREFGCWGVMDMQMNLDGVVAYGQERFYKVHQCEAGSMSDARLSLLSTLRASVSILSLRSTPSLPVMPTRREINPGLRAIIASVRLIHLRLYVLMQLFNIIVACVSSYTS